ncbi:MAG: hypothetical protein FJ267_14935, partial [Planctomycetes bacterium]|nr:hypothetical protein [Planctomycetota bacterium]
MAFARNNLASPSDDLVERLTSLQLCRLQDLHRVQSVVQRLAVDLPLFDSVWIDGLVQIGILTPFQGRLLQENHEQSLRIGPCVLVDVLSRNQTSSTYLARHRIRTERIDDSLGFSVPHHNSDRRWRKSQLSVLKVFQLRDENLDDVMDRLKDLIDHSREVVHPSIVLPNSIFSTAEGQPVVVSRYVSGLSLADLLVRRGRFPHELVLEIARQLIDALAKLEKCGMVHGDLRLATVRMTNRGQPILVE